MQIRKAVYTDLESASALYDKVTLYLKQNVNYPHWTHKLYPCSDTVKEGLETESLFVCEDNGAIVGELLLNTDPAGDYSAGEWSRALGEGEYMIIHALAVDPEVSRRGIGKEMVRFCLNYAEERGFKAIRLDAVPSNIPARRMYEGLGFRFAGEKDLKRYETGIPLFALYEYNLDKQ
ncbi:MAG: GNAT family N-acetyltransferase [Bacteroides sp.]|nr:GNAT family N-acetyltransferase [Bacteroides sp.]